MIWALFSIMAGLGDAVSFAIMKKLSDADIYVKLLFYNVMTLPFLLFGFLFYEIPRVSLGFYIVIIINSIVWIVATFLLMKSLETGDLSASIPILNFTPVFLLFISYLLLGEFPNFQGLVGILVVVAGSYILHISSIKSGYFEPIKSIFIGRGLSMFVVAFLFGITASLAKIGIQLSNPAYFMFMHYLFVSLVLTILYFNKIRENKKQIKANFKYFLVMGIAVAFSEILAGTAFKLTLVPYVISLKRTSIIFSVLIGYLFFREKHFKEAIIGSIIMFIGALLITLS